VTFEDAAPPISLVFYGHLSNPLGGTCSILFLITRMFSVIRKIT